MIKNRVKGTRIGGGVTLSEISRGKRLWLSLILSFVCAALVCCAFILPKNTYKSASAATISGDIYDSANKQFNTENCNALFKAITKNTSASFGDVMKFAEKPQTYASMNNTTVKFGGFDWYATYLTKVGGEVILTLWYANSNPNINEYWNMGYSNTEGDYPSSMYGTSYVRASINSGDGKTRQYYSNPTNLQAMSSSTAIGKQFSLFTNTELKEYIATPAQVQYQAHQNHKGIVFEYTLNNEDFAGPDGETNYGSVNSFVNKTGYDAWKDDLLWLPSLTETGAPGNSRLGMWKMDITSALSLTSWMWLRSAGFGDNCRVLTLTNTAQEYIFGTDTVHYTTTIRPALHLNLSKAFGLSDPTDVEVNYNGSNQTMDDVATTDKTWYDSNLMDLTYPDSMMNVGTYSVKVELNAKTIESGIKFLSEPDTSKGESETVRYFNFIIKPQLVTLPEIIDSEQVYKGSEYTFDIDSNYNSVIMDVEVPTDLTWDSGDKQFKATYAGTYNVIFKLKDTKNYAWDIGGGTSSDQTVPIVINKKELTAIVDSTSEATMEWSLGDSGTVTIKPVACGSDAVSLALYYVSTTGAERSNAVNGHTIDVSKISSIGTYTLRVKIITDKNDARYNEINENYIISGTDGKYDLPASSSITIKAGGVVASSLSWLYRQADQKVEKELLSDGVQELLEYEPLIAKAYIVTARGNDYMTVMENYTANGYVKGFKTVSVAANGDETAVLNGECTAVGKYKTYVAVEINNPDYQFKPEQRFDPGNDKQGWLALEWEISPRTLDFADAKWVYSKGGNDISFDGGNPEYNNGLLITVKLDPEYIRGLGLDPDADITVTYKGDTIKKDKGNYKAKAEIEILNPNYKTPDTADGSDYTIEFDWSITNKQIGIKNWNGKKSIQAEDGRIFTIPVVTAQDGKDYSQFLVYTYTATLKRDDGTTYTVTGGEEVLLAAAKQASSTTLVNIDVTVSIDPLKKDSFDLTGPTSHTFSMGDSKEAINVSLVYNNVEYGDVKFDIKAADSSGFEGYLEYITVTVTSVLLDQPVVAQGSNLSALLEQLVKVGDYTVTLELEGMYAEAFTLFPNTLTFTIAPKQIYVPEVNREIVFTGENIKLENYLDGYDPALMTIDSLEKRDVGTYTATITLKDRFNYVFVKKPAATPEEPAKAAVKIALAGYENSADFTDDGHTEVEMKWQINPYVLDGSLWDLKGKSGAVYNLPAQFAAMVADGTLDLSVGYRYFEDAAGSVIDPEFKSGSTFYVDAVLDGADAGNFVFENGTSVSEKVTYKVPKSGASAIMSNVKDFVTKTWLGLPIWAWLAIGLAVLILLIIIIAVACKRRKSKEQRAEEKARKEEERRLQQERIEAERELARAKQEAELEKIRAQANMANAGMAATAMAMQQPAQQVQQPMPVPVQQPQTPVQQPMQAMQQPVQTGGGSSFESLILEERLRAAEERARYAEERIARAAEERARYAEERTLRAAEERARLAEEQLMRSAYMNRIPAAGGGENGSVSLDALGALVLAALKNYAGGEQPEQIAPAEQPQMIEASSQISNVPTVYPPDAVITTTTTVDTTQKPLRRERGESDVSGFSDLDGFYDTYTEK